MAWKFTRYFIVGSFFLWMGAAAFAISASLSDHLPKNNDVRILIDVSEGMKSADPLGMRVSSLRLLMNMLPERAIIGIWTFGDKSTELVAPQSIPQALRNNENYFRAIIEGQEKNNNLYEALNTVIQNWSKANSSGERNLILLSNGLIKVSDNPGESLASRDRIMEELLPKLKAMNVKVFAVAFSHYADNGLLKALALQTDGLYREVKSDDELNKLFMDYFELNVPADKTPIINNKFTIDESVHEFTLMVFHERTLGEFTLESPLGEFFTYKNRDPRVRWNHTTDFDVVTVTAPQVGAWALHDAEDPSNRVLLVTDLALHAKPLPTNVFISEKLLLELVVTEHGKIMDSLDFLQLIGVNVRKMLPSGDPQEMIFKRTYETPKPEQIRDGAIAVPLSFSGQVGKYEVEITVHGTTFQRHYRQIFEVNPLPFRYEVTVTDDKNEVNVFIFPDAKTVNLQSVSMNAEIVNSETGEKKNNTLSIENNIWHFKLPGIPKNYEHRITLNMQGLSAANRSFKVAEAFVVPGQLPEKYKDIAPSDVWQLVPPYKVRQPYPGRIKEAPIPVEVKPKELTPAEKAKAAKAAKAKKEMKAPPKKTSYVWWIVGGVVGVLLIGGGGAGFWWYRKKKRGAAEDGEDSEEGEAPKEKEERKEDDKTAEKEKK